MNHNRRELDSRIIALEVQCQALTNAVKDTKALAIENKNETRILYGTIKSLDKNQQRLIKQMEPITNAEIAVRYLSRFILWTTGIIISVLSTMHLWDKVK